MACSATPAGRRRMARRMRRKHRGPASVRELIRCIRSIVSWQTTDRGARHCAPHTTTTAAMDGTHGTEHNDTNVRTAMLCCLSHRAITRLRCSPCAARFTKCRSQIQRLSRGVRRTSLARWVYTCATCHIRVLDLVPMYQFVDAPVQ